MTNFQKKYGMLALIAGLVAILDQISKAAVLAMIPLYRTVPVIPGFFNLTHVRNPGGAFGFLADHIHGFATILFIAFTLAAVVLVIYFYVSTPPTHRFLAAGFAMILGGAVGNLIDRLRFGAVVDFLDVYVGRYHWPSFNVADSAVTVGICIFIFHYLANRMPEDQPATDEQHRPEA